MTDLHRTYSVEKSQSLLERARKVEALINAKPSLFFTGYERIGGYPLFVERANGAYIWDVDGNRYIDYILGYGSVILGHAHPIVSDAVREALLRYGSNPTLLSEPHVELAERIVSICPGAESVTFLKTGSDATDAAIRLARAMTGRRYVLRWGMHGWHDWCSQDSVGVLDSTTSYTLPIRYNDLEYARELFSKHRDDVACIILMPYELVSPNQGYLEGLRDLCHQHGALFILDEIRSGFRLALGGAQEYFGIQADLVVYGKALANGHAISALAGRKQYMQNILKLGMTVTYYRMPDAMVAALETLTELTRSAGPMHLRNLGMSLMEGIDQAAQKADVPARSIGLPWTPFLEFKYGSKSDSDRALRMFCNGMLRHGILMSPAHHWFLCTSMNIEDIDRTVQAACRVFDDLRLAF